jgi:hypothetical protein
MRRIVSHSEEITHYRQMLPANNATVHATDPKDLWERPAQDEVDDGADEFDDELVRLIESCIQCGD